jgi:hypothetical protein
MVSSKKMKIKVFFICSLLFYANLSANTKKIIYLVPQYSEAAEHILFNPNERDDCLKPFIELRNTAEKLGYSLKVTKDITNSKNVAAVVVITTTHLNPVFFKQLEKYPLKKCILFLYESPLFEGWAHNPNITKHFGKTFTMLDNFIDNKTYFKFYLPQPYLSMIENIPHFEEKKFCTLIACDKDWDHDKNKNELYSERKKTINFFESFHRSEFDLYGVGWNAKQYPCYKGTITNKAQILQQYKFCICYENIQNVFGYVSEKIFDCMAAGCVPVYWGASNITDYVPADCFIDRQSFKSHDDLYLFLKSIDMNAYNKYLKNIEKFFNSPQASRFSIDNFVKIFFAAIGNSNGL